MTLAVQFTDVSRVFGEVKAVDRVSIDIQDGEFFSMLGPSGSGKTTCLRLIAGFEQPSAGSIRIHGEEAAGHPGEGDEEPADGAVGVGIGEGLGEDCRGHAEEVKR